MSELLSSVTVSDVVTAPTRATAAASVAVALFVGPDATIVAYRLVMSRTNCGTPSMSAAASRVRVTADGRVRARTFTVVVGASSDPVVAV